MKWSVILILFFVTILAKPDKEGRMVLIISLVSS